MRNEQATDGFRKGSLKRHVATLVLLEFTSATDTAPTGIVVFRVRLKNLSIGLSFQLAALIIGKDGTPFRPGTTAADPLGDYPAAPGTMQIIPMTNFTDANKGWLRPVFQDPTNVLNVNAPLPQEIPFGWNDVAETDEIEVEVVVDLDSYNASDVDGDLVVQAMVEYSGSWWDATAILFEMNQVQFAPQIKSATIGTNAL